MRPEDIKQVGVVGGGVMGGGIAQIHAIAGYQVTIMDISQQVIDDTRHEVVDGKWGIKRSVEKGKLGFDNAVSAIDLIGYTTDNNDLSECDLIIEAVPENLELKQDVFAELDKVIKPSAMFASNTSGFVIQEIAEKISDERKTLVVGMHYSNPVPVMTMCEVIYTPQASQETIDTAVTIAKNTRRDVSMCKDMPGTRGFILNRIFGVAREEANKLVEDGIATKEDIDKAMIAGRNWPAAFFGTRGGIGKQW
jgi:3-hydroxybutyryl-CoA dehydrogenase